MLSGSDNVGDELLAGWGRARLDRLALVLCLTTNVSLPRAGQMLGGGA